MIKFNKLFKGNNIMKKTIIALIIILTICIVFTGCNNNTQEQATTTTPATQKAPGKYAESEFLGTWHNADGDKGFICALNDDGTAVFKEDKNATWEETTGGIKITTTVDGTKKDLDGYFVIAGEGYVARATEANMHYLDEGGVLQLEIMLTENTCVDCIKK